MVTTTGRISPSCEPVWALNPLQNSMMFTPCWPSAGPTGGDGFALPAGICSFTIAWTFFATRRSPRRRPASRSRSQPLHLVVLELHGRRPAEHGDDDLHASALGADVLHHALEVDERP